MGFQDAVTSCFRKYFQFSGRARRSEYWYWFLFTIIGAMVFGVMDALLFSSLAENGFEPLGTIFSLLIFLPGLTVIWRRLHDTGRSGWWYGGAMLAIIPIGIVAGFMMFSFNVTENFGSPFGILAIVVGLLAIAWIITLIVFTVQDSQYGENKYGPNPKGEGNVSVFD